MPNSSKYWSTIALTCILATGSSLGCQEVEEPTTVLTQEQWKEVRQHILEEAPTPKYKIGANFNDEIEFIGFDVEEPLAAGKPTTFTWYWKATKDVSQNWEVFVHFDSTAQPFRQNLDHHPVSGMYQTSRWKKGQIIRDIQRVTIRDNYPSGPAVPYIGFYRGNQRLPINNDVRKTDDRRVIGPTLTITGGPAKPVTAMPRYAVQMAAPEQVKDMKIDGKLDEAIWGTVPVVKLAPMGSGGALETTVRAFWTETHLYVGAHMEDEHVWSTIKERDGKLWNEEVFELFVAPKGADGEYMELQINPLGTIFDANFKARLGTGEGTRDEQIDRARAWNLEGLESAVHVDGTINDKDKKDKSWSVELKIPLDKIPGVEGAVATGTNWSVNMYRFDRPEDGVTHAYGWSTQPRRDFHRIDQFGQFRFAGAAPQAQVKPSLSPEAVEQLRERMNMKVEPAQIKKVVPPGN